MRYAQYRDFDISNGEGIGVALFVQGCHFHCKGCFNQSTWDFSLGKEFTQNVIDRIMSDAESCHISRFSILGGEPLANENYNDVLALCKEFKDKFKDKSIWLYTGYTLDEIKNKEILNYIDVLVDGRYVEELRDLSLPFRGSSNQKIYYLTQKG